MVNNDRDDSSLPSRTVILVTPKSRGEGELAAQLMAFYCFNSLKFYIHEKYTHKVKI